MINTKEKIIEYFKSGIKKTKDFKIGIEHEKFLFNSDNNKRIDYLKIKEMFAALLEFGWNSIFEKGYIIGLNKGGKNITLEPGNQIELAGEKLKDIHLVCSESYSFQNQLKEICDELDIKILSVGYDPITKLNNVPTSPRKMRLIADLIRGMGVDLALNTLKFDSKIGSKRLEKLLLSAISNWQEKNKDNKIEDSD